MAGDRDEHFSEVVRSVSVEYEENEVLAEYEVLQCKCFCDALALCVGLFAWGYFECVF